MAILEESGLLAEARETGIEIARSRKSSERNGAFRFDDVPVLLAITSRGMGLLSGL
jgi:hypothetical protein